ncbi:MAG: SCP2 sterol-binding domain-containing protein [Thermodesulfobacteriota bacterium]|nr:SCP2 sterol-binding domain-containing protein [Thermodesulfobacteriota bacterium]
MTEQTFTVTVDVRELLTVFIPKLARQFVAIGGMAEELKGTELTMNVDVSGSVYGYHIKDGVDFDIKEGAIDNPMVHLSISLEGMAKLADMKYIDMLIGAQGQLSKEKNSILATLKGICDFNLKHDDGEVTRLTVTFNGAETPRTAISISMDDVAALGSGKELPVQLFMNGRMAVDGDIAFAMALQPLLT